MPAATFKLNTVPVPPRCRQCAGSLFRFDGKLRCGQCGLAEDDEYNGSHCGRVGPAKVQPTIPVKIGDFLTPPVRPTQPAVVPAKGKKAG